MPVEKSEGSPDQGGEGAIDDKNNAPLFVTKFLISLNFGLIEKRFNEQIFRFDVSDEPIR